MQEPLKIVHVFRDPVGGIFRHVRDLVKAQHEAGHSVGIICDSSTGGAYEDQLFEKISPQLTLGLHRIPMKRSIAPQDAIAVYRTYKTLKEINADVVHCHSAKGGVYGRLGAWMAQPKAHATKVFYCPHGGAMHYGKNSLKGRIFFFAERFLEKFTTSLIFVSGYEKSAYHDKVGQPSCAETIVYNGLSEDEFQPVTLQNSPSDFLYIGMKRDLKGPDVFLDALAIIKHQKGTDVTAYFVGDGPDSEKYNSQIKNLKIEDNVTVSAAMPARDAFTLANIVVVPSRAESMPYLVLEAMAAQKPIICSNVGGIPEIFEDDPSGLVEPGNAEALASAMLDKLNDKTAIQDAQLNSNTMKKRFSLQAMASHMETTYRTSKSNSI